MFIELVGKSSIKRCWIIAVKAAIREYQRKVQEEFLPVLVSDFSKEVVVKSSGGKMSEEDRDKIKVFIGLVGKSSNNFFEKELVKSIANSKVVGGTKELNERLDGVKSVVVEGHKWIFSRFELHVRRVIKETIVSAIQG